jgi:cytidine deaminase
VTGSRPPLTRPDAMGADDAELLSVARELLRRVYATGRHEVATAFRLDDGAIVLGVHVDGSARRSTVCAEGAAAAAVVARGDADLPDRVRAVVSVLRRPSGSWHLIEPCGVCAELLTDYWPDARVWVTEGDTHVATTAAALLPAKRRRLW